MEQQSSETLGDQPGPSKADSDDYAHTTDNDDTTKQAELEKRIPTTISEQDRTVLRDKMKDMFVKLITDIDNQVLSVTESQSELDEQLDKLLSTLDSIKIDEKLTDEISANAKRVSSLKSRLTLIHSILSNSSERCNRILSACGTVVNSLGASRTASISSQPGESPLPGPSRSSETTN